MPASWLVSVSFLLFIASYTIMTQSSSSKVTVIISRSGIYQAMQPLHGNHYVSSIQSQSEIQRVREKVAASEAGDKKLSNASHHHEKQPETMKGQIQDARLPLRVFKEPGTSTKTKNRTKRNIKKAAVAAAKGDKKLAMETMKERTAAHSIFVNDMRNNGQTNEDGQDVINPEFVTVLNRARRAYEAEKDTKQARREIAGHYLLYNTKRQRMKMKVIANYDYKIGKSFDGTPCIVLGDGSKDKHGVHTNGSKSVADIRAGKDTMFGTLQDSWGYTYGPLPAEFIHDGDQHVIVPVIPMLRLFLFTLVNHPLFETISKICRTQETEIEMKLMILFDSKSIKNSTENRATMLILKLHDAFSDHIQSPYTACPVVLSSQKHSKCIDYVRTIKEQLYDHRDNEGWSIPVLHENAEYDQFEIKPDEFEEEDIEHMVNIKPSLVIISSDWSAFCNGGCGPNSNLFLFKSILLCEDDKHDLFATHGISTFI